MAYDSLQPTPVFRMTSGTREDESDPVRRAALSGAGEEPPEEPGDRLAVHGIWEGVLGLATVLVAVGIHQVNGEALFGPGLEAFLLGAASLGLAAVGMGWSLRAGAPNLAVGPIVVAAAMFFTQQAGGGIGFSFGLTLIAATAAGLLLSFVVVGLHVPAWAVSLALSVGLGAWMSGSRTTGLPDMVTYHPGDHAVYWFIGFAGLSLIGGAVGMSRPMRRLIGAFRPQGDPAARPGLLPGVAVVMALVGSCLLAAIAGIMTALVQRNAAADSQLGFGVTGLVLGAVLIGGTSAYGRRAGLAGTFLGVVLLTLVMRLAVAERWQVPVLWYAAGAVVLGLVVTRLVEAFGGPRDGTPRDEEDPGESGESAVQAGTRRAISAGGTQSVVHGEVLTGEPIRPGGLGRFGSASPVLQGRIGDRATRVRYPAIGSGSAGALRPLLHIRPWDTEPPSGPR